MLRFVATLLVVQIWRFVLAVGIFVPMSQWNLNKASCEKNDSAVAAAKASGQNA